MCSCCAAQREKIFLNKEKIDYNFKGAANYNLFYIVDTIEIEDPVLIYHNESYVCSKQLLDSIDIDESFFQRHDVFIFRNYFEYFLMMKSEVEGVRKYFEHYNRLEDDVCYEKSLIYSNECKNLYIHEFNEHISFILALINTNLYKSISFVYTSSYEQNDWGMFRFPYYKRKDRDLTTSYYKIVTPLCNNK